MPKKPYQSPTIIESRAPLSTSNCAPEKKNEKNPIDKPENKIGNSDFLLTRHLLTATPVHTTGFDHAAFQLETHMLYRGLEPRDSAEAILAALTVAVTNSSMDCLSRAARCHDSLPARDVNLRHGLKGASVARDLISALDSRRGLRPKGVTVGEVNVGSGGQAIVGNVESGGRRETSASGGMPRDRANSKKAR